MPSVAYLSGEGLAAAEVLVHDKGRERERGEAMTGRRATRARKSRLSRPRSLVPARMIALSEKLRKTGVLGVSWGDAMRRGADGLPRWTGERVLGVHVRRKLPPAAISPGEHAAIPGMRVDVVEVAHVRHHQIDCGDPITIP